MANISYSLTAADGARSQPANLQRAAAILLVIEALLIFVPTFILGAAINWPASLDEPASINLPLVLAQYPAVIVGYGAYLVYSLLFWPVAYLTGRAIVGHDRDNLLFQIASGFAALSALARALGIVRWLFAMPVLARLYTDPAASSEQQATVSVVYEMLNAYAGGVGELLGVSLFAVIWLVLINVLILRSSAWPNWLGIFGLVAAGALLLNLVEIVGIDLGPMITVSVAVFHFWMLATAVVFWRRPALSKA